MAAQEWITESNLGQFEEETSLANVVIEYQPTTDSGRITLDPILLSSNLPAEITLSEPDHYKINVMGTLPKVDQDTEYYFTYRLKEVEAGNPSNVTNITDRYFTLTSKNKPVTWREDVEYLLPCNNNNILEINLKDYLSHPNGNETFKKVSGTLPEGMTFDDSGTVMGYIEEDIVQITEYPFSVRVYSNNVPVEGLEDKEFIISVDPEVVEQKPTWTTESNLGNINKDEVSGPNETKSIKLNAMILSGGGYLRFELAPNNDPNNDDTINGLPPGLTLRNDGYINGTCTTTQVKDWFFGAYAVRVVEEEDNEVKSDYRKFVISTNRGSAEHEINWTDPTKTYTLGTFTIGEELSLQLPIASAADGSPVKYSFSGNTYPAGITLSNTGLISGVLDLQSIGNYDFEVMAKTDYTYITRKFRIGVKQGLGESALKLYLKINLEYKDGYTDIKNQLNSDSLYNNDIDAYNISNFPKIDVATLKCYDREVLASMLNFGNPEIVRFGLTKSLPYSHVDGSGNLTANYEVFYKSIDENTYQWDEIDNGDYDFEAKLDQLKTTGEIDNSAQLEFNNEVYKTSVKCSLFLGEVDTYAKLVACNTTELKPDKGYYAVVLKDETHDGEKSYYEYENEGAWKYIGTNLPQEVMVTTTPSDTYDVFNFKNVRNLLSQRVYVKQLQGTYYYDEGNQQIVTLTSTIDGIKKLSIAIHDMYLEGAHVPRIKAGEYYIINDDEELTTREESYDVGGETRIREIILTGDPIKVDYESHIVTNPDNGHIYVNILFKPTFGSSNFMIYEDGGEIYHVAQIENPWCFDFDENRNIVIDTVPAGVDMVMPNITSSDVTPMLGGSPYVTFLDPTIEPLPMWKRKQAVQWKPNTTFKAKEIIIYDSIYYKVKQQFTSSKEFIFDANLLEVVNGDTIDSELPKNYFPTLDLGYYYSGTNRKYLKELNAAEKKGEFWYRKDFLFWELIGEPVYNQNIDTFGIPFYSTQNRLEELNKGRIAKRTFELICNTPNAEVSISVVQPDGSTVEPEHTGNKWTVSFDMGSHITWNVSAPQYYPEGGDYVIVSDEKHVISLKKKCTITITPTPSDATVTLTAAGYTQSGNSIVVRDGTEVVYKVEKEGYLAEEGTFVALDFTHNLEVKLKQYKQLTIYVSYTYAGEDETYPNIVLSGENAIDITETELVSHDGNSWEVQKSIKVPEGTYVIYTISKIGLNTKKGNYKVNIDSTQVITLNDNAYTFTVSPTPADATVIIDAELPIGSQVGNSRMVSGKPNTGSSSWITYIVSKNGYETFKETLPYISSDTTVNVTIKQYFQIVIESIFPSDAIVKITNIVGVKGWEAEKIYDEHSIVKYEDKFYNAILAHTSGMAFDPTYWVEVVDSAWVVNGYDVYYEIKRNGYKDYIDHTVVTEDMFIDVRMESVGSFCVENIECLPPDVQSRIETDDPTQVLFCLETNATVAFQHEGSTDTNTPSYTLIVNPVPADAEVVMVYDDVSYNEKTMSGILEGEYVEYHITKDNYIPYDKNILITADTTEDIPLTLVDRTVSIIPTPVDSTITLTAGSAVQHGNGITSPHGTEVSYTVARKYYETVTGTITADADKTIEIPLTREKYTVTVRVTTNDNTRVELTANGYTPVVGENSVASIEVDSETIVRYTLHCVGYVDKTGEIQALSTSTIDMVLTPTYTFTINPIPGDATVELRATGCAQVGNSIIVPSGTEVTYKIIRDRMNTITGSETITSDYTKDITMSYVPGTVLFESATAGTYQLSVLTPGTFYVQMVGGGGAGASKKYNRHVISDTHKQWGGGSGAYVYGNMYLTAGAHQIVVGYAPQGSSMLEGQIAGNGGSATTAAVGPGGYCTITIGTLAGINGNAGEYRKAKNVVANGGASTYGGYGAGGHGSYAYGNGTGVPGYVKITAV